MPGDPRTKLACSPWTEKHQRGESPAGPYWPLGLGIAGGSRTRGPAGSLPLGSAAPLGPRSFPWSCSHPPVLDYPSHPPFLVGCSRSSNDLQLSLWVQVPSLRPFEQTTPQVLGNPPSQAGATASLPRASTFLCVRINFRVHNRLEKGGKRKFPMVPWQHWRLGLFPAPCEPGHSTRRAYLVARCQTIRWPSSRAARGDLRCGPGGRPAPSHAVVVAAAGVPPAAAPSSCPP